MAKPDSWMPIYWADFWHDTRHLNTIERCAYFNLLGAMWVNGGTLTDDSDRLQRLSTVTSTEWDTVRGVVLGFFQRDENGDLYQSRLRKEYLKASKAYDSRCKHMEKVNSDRKQSLSTVTATGTVTGTVDTTHNSHNSIELTDVRTSVERSRKSAERRNRLENDWKPSERDHEYARSCNLNGAEIATIAEQFRRYFTGPDAKNPRKADWHRAWCNWIDRDAPRIIASRSRASGPRSNGREPVGTLAAFASVAAEMERQNHASGGMGRGTDGLRDQPGRLAIGHSQVAGDGEPGNGTDAIDGVCEVVSGTENPDKIQGGNATGLAGNGCAVRPEIVGLPCGRGSQGVNDPSGHSALLASVGGIERKIGPIREEQSKTSGGFDAKGQNLAVQRKVGAGGGAGSQNNDFAPHGEI
jgi:uncharacterized protein YdaU (DUF1376 family)